MRIHNYKMTIKMAIKRELCKWGFTEKIFVYIAANKIKVLEQVFGDENSMKVEKIIGFKDVIKFTKD